MSWHLPNLLIAGFPKAGTTSLFNYFGQHRDIGASDVKELHYFTPLRYGRSPASLRDYERHFEHCATARYRMEASPSYVYSGDKVLQAVRNTLPDAKVVILVRDPVERLWSAYNFQRSRGKLPRIASFDEYVEACTEARQDGTDQEPGNVLMGLSIGFYADFLPSWLNALGGDATVAFFDELVADPAVVVSRLCGWLGIDVRCTRDIDYAARNQTLRVRSQHLGRLGHAVRRLLPPSPDSRVASVARTTYEKLNRSGSVGVLTPEHRQRLGDLYRDSNLETARLLRARGYGQLPDWLN